MKLTDLDILHPGFFMFIYYPLKQLFIRDFFDPADGKVGDKILPVCFPADRFHCLQYIVTELLQRLRTFYSKPYDFRIIGTPENPHIYQFCSKRLVALGHFF